jgi:2-oxoglutarate ferredoxin oxidoreductase subunit beta
VNTFAWYKKRVYNLDEDAGYNPTDKIAAFTKAMEWGDKIPTGVIFREDRQSYTDKVSFLKESTLVDLPVETEVIKGFLQEFM